MRGEDGKAFQRHVGIAVVLEIAECSLAGEHVELIGQHHATHWVGRVLQRFGVRHAEFSFRAERAALEPTSGLRLDHIGCPLIEIRSPAKANLPLLTDWSSAICATIRAVSSTLVTSIGCVPSPQKVTTPASSSITPEPDMNISMNVPLQDVNVLNAASGDRLVSFAAQVEQHVFAGCGLEEVERVVRRQHATDTVAHSSFGERDLSINDHVRATLNGGHDCINTLRGTVERGVVGKVAEDDLSTTFEQRRQCSLLVRADKQANMGVGLFEQMVSDTAAEHASRTHKKNGFLLHSTFPFLSRSRKKADCH